MTEVPTPSGLPADRQAGAGPAGPTGRPGWSTTDLHGSATAHADHVDLAEDAARPHRHPASGPVPAGGATRRPAPSTAAAEAPCASRRIARNFAALSVAEVACRAISMVVTLSLAQRLGRAGYGRIEFAFNVVFWLVLLVREGLDVIATREIARHPRLIRPLVNHILAIRGCLATGLLTGLVLVAAVSFSEADRAADPGALRPAAADDRHRARLRLPGAGADGPGGRLAADPDGDLRRRGRPLGRRRAAGSSWVPICLVVGEVCGIALVWACYVRRYGWPRPTLRATRALRTIIRRGRPVYLIQISQAVIGSADLLVIGVLSAVGRRRPLRGAAPGDHGGPDLRRSSSARSIFPMLARTWRASAERGPARRSTGWSGP